MGATSRLVGRIDGCEKGNRLTSRGLVAVRQDLKEADRLTERQLRIEPVDCERTWPQRRGSRGDKPVDLVRCHGPVDKACVACNGPA